MFAVSAIASEAANQPFEAQLNVARAVRDNAPCGDPHYLTGYGIAIQDPTADNYHARAYFDLDSLNSKNILQWFMASFMAYTEEPRITIRHFDNVNSTAWWWDSPQACPNGYYEIGELRFC